MIDPVLKISGIVLLVCCVLSVILQRYYPHHGAIFQPIGIAFVMSFAVFSARMAYISYKLNPNMFMGLMIWDMFT